jgi:hypothetical protein
MTDKPLTMKIATGDGGEYEIPAVECEHCDGTGILARSAKVERHDHITGAVDILELKPGDRCAMCNGKGRVGSAGGSMRPAEPKPSQLN